MPAANVKYAKVPTEPDMLQPADERHAYSRTSSRTYSDASETDQRPDRRRHDRRRGRLNSELLTAVQDGNLQEVTRYVV